ncbi:transcription termination factor MTERF15, mitochondrial-like [Vicia villosa]|uniref:transcription termination factor MTERF15, mitochondrial-like n=1 Tax=Vicia villosa TaxID=3911 RepID=UPI00273CD254|nr:transcription termination factor MTERF15, mitochondrial-like [Vicia villosa]
MFTTHRHRSILYLKALTFPPTSNPNPNFHHFCTTSSNSTPFPVSYLIHNLGFSPQLASKLSSTYSLRFKTNQNPDLVLNFFRTHGLSDSQLRHMIAKAPWLLSCDPFKRVLPKFQFFLSKGASTSDIVNLVTKCPAILSPSLENHIVPTYEFLSRFLQSHKDIVAYAIQNHVLFSRHNVSRNVRMLIESGVPESSISRLLRMNSKVLNSTKGLLKLVEEVKELGFNPSHSHFSIALHAKRTVLEARWKEKVDAFKKWGWSDEDVLEAFRKHPHCMLASVDKINIIMNFWVNQLGWDAMAIANVPRILGASMERKIIPRSSVLQYLLKNGLLKEKASLTSPFLVGDETFIEKYIMPFKEDSSYLVKLYEEKLNLAQDKDNKDGMI